MAKSEVQGRDSLRMSRPIFGTTFEATFQPTGEPVRVRFECIGKGLQGEMQDVAIEARVETVDPSAVDTDVDRESPPWTPDMFGAAKLKASAEVEIACEAEAECVVRFNGQCQVVDTLLPDSVLDLEWAASVRSRADLSCASRDVKLVEVPPM